MGWFDGHDPALCFAVYEGCDHNHTGRLAGSPAANKRHSMSTATVSAAAL